ncbi:MAG: PTS sugar transporter subunit IIA [Pseudobdellovibrionaceae bacterium]
MQSGRNIQAIFGVESDFLKEAIKASMTKSSLFSPAKGRVLPLREVPDNAFAENILGEGFAVEPQEGMIYAPCSGQIVNIFPTKHALGILSEDGLEVLVHVGIDTVQMKGEGFQSFVAEGQHVNVGDRLIGFDLELVRQKAKSLITPIVITNMDTVEALKLVQEGSVTAGQKTLEVLFKA